MAEQFSDEAIIKQEWEKTVFAYQQLGKTFIDSLKLFASHAPAKDEPTETAPTESEQRSALLLQEHGRWQDYLGFDPNKKPEDLKPEDFNLEKKKEADEKLAKIEERIINGETITVDDEETIKFLDNLPIVAIWERAPQLTNSKDLKEYFEHRDLPKDLTPEEKSHFEAFRKWAGKSYEELMKELDKNPDKTKAATLTSEGPVSTETPAAEPEKPAEPEPLLPSGKRATWLRAGAVFDEKENFHLGIGISGRMSRPGRQPLATKIEGESPKDMVFFGINIPTEIEAEARKLQKENGDEYQYLQHVATKLGWLTDENGGYVIPADQIEKLTENQYEALLFWNKNRVETTTPEAPTPVETPGPETPAEIPQNPPEKSAETKEEKKGLGFTEIKVAYPERQSEGTTIYIKNPEKYKVDGAEVPQVTLKPPELKGPESAALFVKTPHLGDNAEEHTGMKAGALFNWENISSLHFTDSLGNPVIVPKEELSLKSPEKPEEKPAETGYPKNTLYKDYEEDLESGVMLGEIEEKKPEGMPEAVGDQEHALHGDFEEELEVGVKPEEAKKPTQAPAEEAGHGEEKTDELKSVVTPGEASEEKKPTVEEAGPYGEGKTEETPYEETSGQPEKITFVAAAIANPFEAPAIQKAQEEMQVGAKELTRIRDLPIKILKFNWFREYLQEKSRQRNLAAMRKADVPYADKLIDQARQQAISEGQTEAKGIKGLWERTVGREKAIQQRTLTIIGEWDQSGRLKQFEEVQAHDASLEATTQRFISEHDQMIHKDAGEEVKLLDETDAKQKEISDKIRGFINQYVTGHFAGTLDERSLTEELNRYLATQVPKEHFGQAELYAHSLKETASSVIAQLEHLQGATNLEEAIAKTVSGVEIKMGKAVWGVRSEAKETTRVERIVRKIRETLPGATFVNEAFLATIVSLALSFGTRLAPAFARRAASMAIPVFGGAVVGGGFHGFQENQRLKEERITHLRERSQGLKFGPEDKRRAWMEQFVYSSRTAQEATDTFSSLLYESPQGENPKVKELDEQGAREIFAQLADLKARISISDREKIDLISFSSRTQVEVERTKLDQTLAEAEIALKKQFEAKAELAQKILQGKDFDTYIKELSELAAKAHLDGTTTNIAELQKLVPQEKTSVQALDQEFQAKRRWRAIFEGAKTAAYGAAIGEACWEFSHIKDLGAEHPQVITPFGWAVRKLGWVKEAAPTVTTSTSVASEIIQGPSENLSLKYNPKGFYELVKTADGQPIPGAENLGTNTDGSFTREATEILAKHGVPLHQEVIIDPSAPLIEQGVLKLPQGLRLVDPDGNGKYDLISTTTGRLLHPDLKDLDVNLDTGEVSASSQALFAKAGLDVARKTSQIVHEVRQETTTPVSEWLGKHLDKTVRVLRKVYYDNDTHMYRDVTTGKLLGADLNELKLWWGGKFGTGLTENGDYAFSISHMTKDGSFHKGLAVDAMALAKEGKLRLLLSLAKGTQSQVAMVDVPADAKDIIIPKASEFGKTLFSAVNNQAEYDGFAVEVAQIMDVKDGVQQVGILATHLGENSLKEITETVSVPVPETIYSTIITSPGKFFRVTGETMREALPVIMKNLQTSVVKVSEWLYQGPPVIPLRGRRPLERAGGEIPPIPPYPEYPEYPAYPEYPQEYEEYYPSYPEYGEEAYEAYPYPEYGAYLPYYEEAYESLKLPEQEREELRKLTPKERVKKLAEKAKVSLTEEKPYPIQMEELASQLGIKLEEAGTPTIVLKEREKELEYRLKTQEHYLEALKNKWTLASQNSRILETLYKLNGATKGYYEELETLDASLPPMSEECELAVVIPAYNEEPKIERTLRGWVEQYEQTTGQLIKPEKIEIIILVNRPNKEAAQDKTLEVIPRLKNQPPFNKFSIHALEKTFNFLEKSDSKEVTINGQAVKVTGGVNMGLVYALVADLAILRNSKRKNQDKKANLLLRSGGADVYARNPNFVDRTLRIFREKPELEQYNSRADYPTKIYEHVPLLHVVDRFHEMMNIQYTHKESALGLGTYRAALYAETGGFNPDVAIAEEVNLNIRMRRKIAEKMAQESKERKDFIKRDLVLNAIDDPRRSLAALWRGIPLLYSYGGFDDRMKLEPMAIEEVLNKTVPPEAQLTGDNLQHQLEPYWQYYIRKIFENSPKTKGNFRDSCALAEKFLKRSFTFLGLRPEDYELIFDDNVNQQTTVSDVKSSAEKCRLRIKDISNLQRLLQKYKSRPKPDWTM